MPLPEMSKINDMFSSVVGSVRSAIPPVHKEGHVFIVLFAVVTLVFAFFALWFLFATGLFLTAWCVAFFRDAPRFTPIGEKLVVSPADGTVLTISDVIPPPELELGSELMTRICIFMSVFNGHINRAPITGRVTHIAYSPGLFVNADLDKASEHNERNAVVIENDKVKIGVVQIAGLVARRIVCFVKVGADLRAGERFGLIRFGSRVDVYLPLGVKVNVTEGLKTIAGETILAEFSAKAARTPFITN